MEAPSPRALLAYVIVLNVLGTAVLGLFAAFFVTGNDLLKRIMLGVLAVELMTSAVWRLVVVAARSRRPRWQRAYAVVLLMGAAFVVVIAFSGV